MYYIIPGIMALVGAYFCYAALKNMILHGRGQTVRAANGQPLPFFVWPFFLFTGAMVLAGAVPSLLGEPMWLLNQVFAVIAALQDAAPRA